MPEPTELLERDDDLATLDAVVDAACQRHGAVVLLAGEAGIGKTTLVTTWVQRLDPTSTRTLVGWCDDFLTGRTLGPLRDVARTVGGALADAVERAEIGAVLDAMMAVLDDPLRTVVLILEDLHWADEATLDVVRYVGRRIQNLPAVLVLTYRDEEVAMGHPLAGVLGALAGTTVHRIGPAPLSQAAIATLLGDSDRDPSAVAAVTAGNPFFVTEVARTRGDDVPLSVTDTVLARVRALPPEPRHALETLAVVPGALPATVAEQVVGDVGLLAEAERRGLLAPSITTVRFRHELVRRAVEGALTTIERARAHRRVLDVLLAQDSAEPFLVLHHAVGAGAREVLASHGPAAATEALHAGAHRQAAVLHEQVLRVADLLPPEVHARLRQQHAWALYDLHRFHDAVASAQHAVRIREELGEPVALARALLVSSRMSYIANDPATAVRVLDQAVEVAATVTDPELTAEMLVHRAQLLLLVDRGEEAAALVGPALDAARRVGAADLEVLALNYRGLLRANSGEVDQGLADLARAVARGKHLGALEATARSHTNLVEELVRAGRWDEAEVAIEAATAFYDDHEFVSHRYNTTSQRGMLWLWRGRWDLAEPLFRHLLTSVEQGGVLVALALIGLARIAVWRGDDDAEELVEWGWRVALASGAAQYITAMGGARLEFAWLHARPDLVPDTLERALLPAAPPRWRAGLLRSLQMSGLDDHGALDDLDPEAYPEPFRSGLDGDWRAAADGWAGRGAGMARAMELATSADVDAMLEGLAVLDGLGAAAVARWVRGRLRDAGVRAIPRGPQPATRDNPAGLTDRQLDVLGLLVEGRTNAEIAEQLVVSVRTVDHHVSAILQKLGVATRREAAEAAQRLAPS